MFRTWHVVNRGVDGKRVFRDEKDLERFTSTLAYYKQVDPVARFAFKERQPLKPLSKLMVEILTYCLMPDHFHLILQENRSGGVSKFMSKVTNSYTRYFNSKYDRAGSLFGGSFKRALIEDDYQLVNLSRYIHTGPLREKIVIDLRRFPFSSYLHHLGLRDDICDPERVVKQFSSLAQYEAWVRDEEDFRLTLPRIKPLLLEKLVERSFR